MGSSLQNPQEKDSSLADEMADILFVLICLANQTGVDLESAFQENLAKENKSRP